MGPNAEGEPVTATDESIPTIADVDRLVTWMDVQGLGTGAPLEHRYISGGSQNKMGELRRGDLHCAMRIPPPKHAWRARRRHRPRVEDHRSAERHGRAAHRGHRRVHRPGRPGPDLLPDGLRRRLVADGHGEERRLACAVRHGPRRPAGPGLPVGGGHRPAVEGRLEGPGPRGPRAPRRLPRAPGGSVDRLLRAHQGTSSCPASTRRRPGCGPTSRSTTSRASCTATTSLPT